MFPLTRRQARPRPYPVTLNQKWFPSIVLRDGYRCNHCHCTPIMSSQLTVDHIYPRFVGGTKDLENLQLLCGKCHRMKGILEKDMGWGDCHSPVHMMESKT